MTFKYTKSDLFKILVARLFIGVSTFLYNYHIRKYPYDNDGKIMTLYQLKKTARIRSLRLWLNSNFLIRYTISTGLIPPPFKTLDAIINRVDDRN